MLLVVVTTTVPRLDRPGAVDRNVAAVLGDDEVAQLRQQGGRKERVVGTLGFAKVRLGPRLHVFE